MHYIFFLLILFEASKTTASEAIFNFWKKGRFDQAISLCIDTDQRLLAKTIRASRLLDPGYRGHYCSAAMDFLRQNPRWIQRTAIIKKGESLMHRWSSKDIVSWCDKYAPISGKAHRLYAIASEKQYGITENTIALIRKGWVYGSFSLKELHDYLSCYKQYLTPETHQDRLSHLLLQENISEVCSLLPLLDAFQEKKASDCILLLQKDKKSLEIFSSYNQNHIDKDLIYSFFKSHKDGSMIKLSSLILLFNALSKFGPDAERSSYWSEVRDTLARAFIAHKDYSRGYIIIKDAVNGNQFLSGWLALNFLNKPKLALEHFLQMMQYAKSSHIYAKGYYWIGKSLMHLGRIKEAHVAFNRSAALCHTFYGQLSLLSLGRKQFLSLNPDLKQLPLKDHREILQVVYLLSQHLRYDIARPMCKVLFDKLTRSEILYALDVLAITKHLPTTCYWNCTIGELASERGVVVTKYLYPLLNSLPKISGEKSLVYAVIKQESGFNAKAKSAPNAIGLMQILPNTALSVAKTYSINAERIDLFDSNSNLHIGSLYLSNLLRRYKGNYVTALAAYNAGPSKVYQWNKNNGKMSDNSNIDEVVEWIEKIPFIATRRYVQGVIANQVVYSALLNGDKSILPAFTPLNKMLSVIKVTQNANANKKR